MIRSKLSFLVEINGKDRVPFFGVSFSLFTKIYAKAPINATPENDFFYEIYITLKISQT
jgi:hypothetical protein